MNRHVYTRTSVDLPPELADRLSRVARHVSVALAGVVLDAYLDQHRTLRERYNTERNWERKALGLPPESPEDRYGPNDSTISVSLYIKYAANEQLTAAANTVGLSRKRYITELLHLHLRGLLPGGDA